MEINDKLIDFEGVKEFKKNNPQFKLDNIYVCQSVDMDGNIVDTKYGANIVTDFGLKDMMVSGRYEITSFYMCLGSGDADPSYGPSDSHSLNMYISALDSKARDEWWYIANPDHKSFSVFEYDPVTKVQSTSQPVTRHMWEYTDGNNQLYTIREIGMFYSNQSVDKLSMHALIYDSQGQKSYIEKKPNTRLFITFYVTYGTSFADVPVLYDQGVYVYANALLGHPYKRSLGAYINCIMRCNCYLTNRSDWYSLADTSKGTSVQYNYLSSDDDQRVMNDLSITESNPFFWEDPATYCSGFLMSDSEKRSNYIESLTKINDNGYAILTFERMVTSEELETFYATADRSNSILPNDSYYRYNPSDVDLYYRNLGTNFGICHSRGPVEWKPTSGGSNTYMKQWDFGAHLPCSNFNITELNMYNHLTKEYDIDIDYFSDPDFEYNEFLSTYLYIRQYVHFDGIDKWVYVFIFPKNYGNITKFENTGISICATDAYWDVSTYEAGRIPDLTNVPVELQKKRYYIITNGNVQRLLPTITGLNDAHKMILPQSRQAFEFPTELSPTHFYGADTSVSETYCAYSGCKPIIDQTHGFFVTPDKIIYLDSDNDVSNAVTYPLSIQGYANKLSRLRRYLTKNGDKLLIFNGYYAWLDDGWKTDTRPVSKNHFVIYTITDKNTAPTAVEYDLTFQDTSSMDNDTYHKYTWSSNGFLVAQKQIGGDEAVVVDVYGDQDSNYEPTQHSILNAQHCFALELTDNCVYYDTAESSGTAFVFKVYDMKNREVIDTFTIDDATAYTVEGIYGWREFVYVQVIANSIHSTYLYDINSNRLQKLHSDFWWSRVIRTDMYSWGHYIAIDDCFIWCAGVGANENVFCLKASDPTQYYYLFNTDYVNSTCYTYSYYPCIGTCNDGKQLILTYITGNAFTMTVDLGLFLDKGPIQHATNAYNADWLGRDKCKVSGSGGYMQSIVGSYFPFNDGVIIISGNRDYNFTCYGKMWWQPIECKLPLHMKGTTYTINAYNDPIKWWGKSYQLSFTNNIAKFNNGGE